MHPRLALLMVALIIAWVIGERWRRQRAAEEVDGLLMALAQGAPGEALGGLLDRQSEAPLSAESLRALLARLPLDRVRTVLALGPAELPAERRANALAVLAPEVWAADDPAVIGAVLAGLEAIEAPEAALVAGDLVERMRARATPPACAGTLRVDREGWAKLSDGGGIDAWQALAWARWVGGRLSTCDATIEPVDGFAWCAGREPPWQLGLDAGQIARAHPLDRKTAFYVTCGSTETPASGPASTTTSPR